MSKQFEIWTDIPGLQGRYQAGSLGNIKSLERVVSIGINKRISREKIRRPSLNRITGYSNVSIKVNGISKYFLTHRLIASAFIPNPENKPQVNHKNGIKTDNRVENLEWATSSENSNHRYNILNIRLFNNKSSKKFAQYQDGKLIKIWPSGAELGRAGFNRRNISTAIKKNRKCAGFNWQMIA